MQSCANYWLDQVHKSILMFKIKMPTYYYYNNAIFVHLGC